MNFELDDPAAKLLALANATFSDLEPGVPCDEPTSKSLILELVQVLDFKLVRMFTVDAEDELSLGSTMVLLAGWNYLLSRSIRRFSHGGIYLRKATPETFAQVTHFLHMYGRACTLKLVAGAVHVGECHVSLTNDVWSISRVDEINDPLLIDSNEFKRSAALQRVFDESTHDSIMGWTMVDNLDHALISKIGCFQQRRPEFVGKPLYCQDLDERIAALVRPFDTGYGVITAYDASPETDFHFVALAVELFQRWRDEAGVHPDIVFGNYKASDVLAVAVLLVSLHLKHIRFCAVAKSIFAEISLAQSLSIWTKRGELVESISALSNDNISVRLVEDILDLLIFKHEDASQLSNYSPLFIPLLIDMGGDMLLRPVSSVAGNPVETIKAMLHWRIPNTRNLLAAPRENWFREDIYAMFRGTRYVCVPGNIKLRLEGKILTDVDAAVFDRTTGELGLFQLKWQDYATPNKKELRSRARNLSAEMDAWAEAVYMWIKRNSVMNVVKTFRLPLEQQFPKCIYLFGVSRRVARTGGYGAVARHGSIALCNFAQLSIARTELGPAVSVLGALHERLFKEMDVEATFAPLPARFVVSGDVTIDLPDYFYRLDDEGSSQATATAK
jgi:hypothetical protein